MNSSATEPTRRDFLTQTAAVAGSGALAGA